MDNQWLYLPPDDGLSETDRLRRRIEGLKASLAEMDGKYWEAVHRIAGLEQSRRRAVAAWRERKRRERALIQQQIDDEYEWGVWGTENY